MERQSHCIYTAPNMAKAEREAKMEILDGCKGYRPENLQIKRKKKPSMTIGGLQAFCRQYILIFKR